MRKTLFLILFALLVIGSVFGQGAETFTNSAATATYANGFFVGDSGVTWTYNHSRDQDIYPIDGNGLMLRRASDSYLTATLPGGLGSFSFQYMKAFTGTSARQLELYVNDVVVETTEVFGTETVPTVYTMTVPNINTTGDVTIKIKNVGTTTSNRQTTVDNISWTGYAGGTPTVATPTFTPPAGTYTTTQTVTISCATVGATILYSTTGVAPWTNYTAPITVSTTTTITAYATKVGMTQSSETSALYSIKLPSPTFNPVAGTYTSAQTVTLSCVTDGATIHYSTTGGAPWTNYTVPISVPTTTTITAYATKTGVTDSATASALYTINTSVPAAEVILRPSQIDISTATSESAVLMKVSGYPSDDVRYRLYNGTNQYNCWNAATEGYIDVVNYAEGPQVPGAPTTSSTWWILFQRGNNNAVSASYRDRIGPTYPGNYQTTALPTTTTAIATPLLITKANVTFNTWNTYAVKYVILAYDATTAGTLISATSSALDTGGFDLKINAETTIMRIEVRDVLNNLIESVTGTWNGSAPTPIITVTGVLQPFETIVNNPSELTQSYTLVGTNLNSSIIVTAPNGFQLSEDGIDGWASPLTLSSDYSGLVYVRMLAGVSGEYTGNITHTSTGATLVSLAVSGEAFDPSVEWNITESLTPFSSEAGTPSSVQSYTLSATGATASLIVSVDAPYELSTTASGPWATSLDLLYTFNGSIYVRRNASAAGTYNTNIVHATTNASNYDLPITGISTLPAGDYATDLFFSEYVMGVSNNKALEIFNGTGAAIDLSDYRYENWYNGGSVHSDITLSGTLINGAVYVLAHTSASPAIQAIATVLSGNISFNGDDALVLRKISTDAIVDIFGVIGQDPGTQWTADGGYTTLKKTLVRKPTVTGGITVNPTISTPPVTTDFVTLGTEWDMYNIDTISDLGSHTFAPGAQVAVAPVLTPGAGVYSSPVNVTMSSPTPNKTIYYTIDGSVPSDTNGFTYSTPVAVSATTTIKAITYATGYTHSSVTTAGYVFPTLVSNIAALRAQDPGATIYKLTGEAVLTFQNSPRNVKYIQDATAAIVIDDPSAAITTAYNLYDGISGITGTLGLYFGMLQFTPVANPGVATSTNHVIVPEIRTLASLTSADQAKLIKVMNVTLDPALVNFPATASDINATDASETRVLRTLISTDYVGEAIPTVPTDIVCLVGEFTTGMQISPRFLADMTPHATGTLDTPVVTISRTGNSAVLTWTAIAGAAGGYRIESSADPYGTFTLAGTVAAGITTWSQTSSAKMFYRVIALQ